MEKKNDLLEMSPMRQRKSDRERSAAVDMQLYPLFGRQPKASGLSGMQSRNEKTNQFPAVREGKETKMSDLGEFMECLSEATKELVENVEEAWDELKVDLREVVTVKYLRPGGVAYCKTEGKKYYGILTGTQIISLNKDGEPEYFELKDFLSSHDSDKLKVAGKNRIAVGKHEIDYAARMEIERDRYPSTKAFVLHCIDATGTNSVDAAIEQKSGPFDWLGYDFPETSKDEDDSREEDAE